MKFNPILVLFLTLTSWSAFSQMKDITAQIVDAETKKPIPNVSVTADSVNWTFSNVLGFFNLKIPADKKNLFVYSIGYKQSMIATPADGRFKILLEKKRVRFKELDLSAFGNLNDLRSYQRSVKNLNPENTSPYRNAVYKNDEYDFFHDLVIAIKTDSVYAHQLLRDTSRLIGFTVNKSGKIEDIKFSIDSVTSRVSKWFEDIVSFQPALQNNKPCDQFFEIPITWSSIPPEKLDEVYSVVEEPASPQGGMSAFYKFVDQNLKYPTQARPMGTEGRVFLEFIVDSSGKLTDIKVIRGIGAGCDEEAVRVVASSANWLPGRQLGKPVRQKMVIPITFNLSGGKISKGSTSPSSIHFTQEYFSSFKEAFEKGLNNSRVFITGKQIELIPKNISEFIGVRVLDLEKNQIKEIPESIGEMKMLEELYLPFNKIETLPLSIAKLKLRILGLSKNNFTEFPEVVTKIKTLETLDLGSNNIQSLPASLEDSNLKFLA